MKKLVPVLLIFVLLSGCKSGEEKLVQRADKLHREILTVDTHCDTPMRLMQSDFDLGVNHDDGCVDFPRMNEGGLDAEFFAVFLGQGPRDSSSYQHIYEQTLTIFEAIHRNVEMNSSMAGIAKSPGDAYKLKKDGKIAAFIGIENGYPLANDITRIKEFYDLGARYITLCHSKNNDICDSSTDANGPEHNGLSEFGKEVVQEMNRLGMMVDVSHISDKSFYDVIEVSKAPVIASHSSARSLCSSPRNLTDDMLQALKSNGGVIQICILSSYIKTPEPNPELESRMSELRDKYGDLRALTSEQRKAYSDERRELWNKYRKLATVSDVVDHIDHVVQVIGIDHVGIGTDFDGGGGVEGCMSVAEMKNITIELLRRGYTRPDVEKIWGGNFMRVFRQVEEIAGIKG
ncbi:MAG TPA: dipeptidase [Bacteroidales bacterium]|nr:dipeptidase [Bacteroidales bacterium]HPF03473.1 dipeptidase [Bacteroidales bacterium]HPJ60395.1 dipeptidase [Bacteroidales bacterium]HPR12745.1 dipeptidase [Bacteroidales bacterium]HRW86751.1 dipeptidase [Bacteroidales bacterium]